MDYEEKLRYGISALDISYKNNAENDELLVRSSDGKMYYKRLNDGQIVSYDSLEYDKKSLINAVGNTILSAGISLVMNENNYLVYNTIDISGKTNILDTNETDLNISTKFKISQEKGFFIRIRGTDNTNAVVSFLSCIKKNIIPVKIDIDILMHFNNSDDITKKIQLEINFNELHLVSLDELYTHDTTSAEISINKVTFNFDDVFSVLPDAKKDLLRALNDENLKLEADVIDIITFVNDLNNVSLYSESDKIKLLHIIGVDVLQKEMYTSDGVVVSEEQPNHRCLWAQIKK